MSDTVKVVAKKEAILAEDIDAMIAVASGECDKARDDAAMQIAAAEAKLEGLKRILENQVGQLFGQLAMLRTLRSMLT